MEPVLRGFYSRAHLEELLDEERAKVQHLSEQLVKLTDAAKKEVADWPEWKRKYRLTEYSNLYGESDVR